MGSDGNEIVISPDMGGHLTTHRVPPMSGDITITCSVLVHVLYCNGSIHAL